MKEANKIKDAEKARELAKCQKRPSIKAKRPTTTDISLVQVTLKKLEQQQQRIHELEQQMNQLRNASTSQGAEASNLQVRLPKHLTLNPRPKSILKKLAFRIFSKNTMPWNLNPKLNPKP